MHDIGRADSLLMGGVPRLGDPVAAAGLGGVSMEDFAVRLYVLLLGKSEL